MVTKEKKQRKAIYRVYGYAEAKGGTDIVVQVSASTPEAAKEAAVKENPALAKMKDVRIYSRTTTWARVS
jgi:hypothetical protein